MEHSYTDNGYMILALVFCVTLMRQAHWGMPLISEGNRKEIIKGENFSVLKLCLKEEENSISSIPVVVIVAACQGFERKYEHIVAALHGSGERSIRCACREDRDATSSRRVCGRHGRSDSDSRRRSSGVSGSSRCEGEEEYEEEDEQE